MKILHFIHLTVLLLFIESISLFSQQSVFDTKIDNVQKLPPLNIYIDNEELATAYLHREVFTTREYEDDELSGELKSSVFFEDKKVLDARNIFEHYLDKELLETDGKVEGKIGMMVKYYDYDYNMSAFGILNVLTFGVGALLGIPSFTGKTVLEVDMTIYDSNLNRIAEYTAVGKNRFFQGFYFKRMDQRESNLKALKDALESINEQVMGDYDEIVGKLGL